MNYHSIIKLAFYKQIRITGKCPKVFENRLIYCYTTVLVTLSIWGVTQYYSNRVVRHCTKVSFQELLNCIDYLFENNECSLDHKHIIT